MCCPSTIHLVMDCFEGGVERETGRPFSFPITNFGRQIRHICVSSLARLVSEGGYAISTWLKLICLWLLVILQYIAFEVLWFTKNVLWVHKWFIKTNESLRLSWKHRSMCDLIVQVMVEFDYRLSPDCYRLIYQLCVVTDVSDLCISCHQEYCGIHAEFDLFAWLFTFRRWDPSVLSKF